jgi:nucleoredoxin
MISPLFARIGLISAALLMLPGAFAEVRLWTKTNGEKVEAELAGETKSAIKLKTKTGSVEIWSKDRLSDEDRAFIGLEGSSPAYVEPSAPDNSNSAPVANLTRQLSGKLVALRNGVTAPVSAERLNGAKYYAFYYSASWCGPCRQFTPELVRAYDRLKASHPEFEVVFISADRSAEDMVDYMKGDRMKWTALRYDLADSDPLSVKYRQNGIPNLVFVDGNGRVLSASYVNGNYVGPQQVLSDIIRTLN